MPGLSVWPLGHDDESDRPSGSGAGKSGEARDKAHSRTAAAEVAGAARGTC